MRWLRRVRTGARLALAFGLVGLLAAAAVAALVVGHARASAAQRDLDALERLAADSERAAFFNADMSGWQAFYVLDAVAGPGPEAALAADSYNRKSFVDEEQQIRAWLGGVDTSAMTADERSSWKTVVAAWETFFAEDEAVAALVARGTPAAYAAVWKSLNEGASMDAWEAIVEATDAIRASVAPRVAAAEAERDATRADADRWGLGYMAVALLAMSVVAWMVTRSITVPLADCVRALDRMAVGDLTAATGVQGRDEVARVGKAVDASVARLRAVLGEVGATAAQVADAGDRLRQGSSALSAAAAGAAGAARDVEREAAEVSAEVVAVSAGSAVAADAIGRIASAAAEAAEVSAAAAGTAGAARDHVTALGQATSAIDEAVGLIRAVSHQTRMLALNATIEAARAGEAGKGFAVVAGEVKDLARQAAMASEGITAQVEQIGEQAAAAADLLTAISEVVESVNAGSQRIAGAVDDQAASTRSTTDAADRVAARVQQITADVAAVSAAASTTAGATAADLRAAEELAAAATRLSGLVGTFTLGG